jgi:Raf kinase inhibitor-like YbhB/YbcL family protein
LLLPIEEVSEVDMLSKRTPHPIGFSLAAATLLAATTYATHAPAQGFSVTSPVFQDGGDMPTLYTCEGSNVSPPLTWGDSPQGAQSFAITLEDQDARKGQRPFMHWIVFNLPPDTRALGEAMRRGRLPGTAGEGMNDFKREGYDGPCPPSGIHRYMFTVHALDTMIDRVKLLRAPWPDIEKAMEGHVIGTATLTVSYEKGRSR